MEFSKLMESARREGGVATLDIPEDWMQGRSAFGGLQVALALHAMRGLVPAELPLRALLTTFMAPVPGGAVRAEAQVQRSGKNVTYVEARVMVGGDCHATVQGVFGAARTSQIALRPTMPQVSNREGVLMPYRPGVTPAFTQHFAARWIRGGLPFTGTPDNEHVIEVALRDQGVVSEAHLVAIADFVPPVALSQMTTFSPGSSVTWLLELVGEMRQDQALAGWRLDVQLVAAAHGYTSQSTAIWNPAQQLVAISHQTMVVFG